MVHRDPDEPKKFIASYFDMWEHILDIRKSVALTAIEPWKEARSESRIGIEGQKPHGRGAQSPKHLEIYG